MINYLISRNNETFNSSVQSLHPSLRGGVNENTRYKVTSRRRGNLLPSAFEKRTQNDGIAAARMKQLIRKFIGRLAKTYPLRPSPQ